MLNQRGIQAYMGILGKGPILSLDFCLLDKQGQLNNIRRKVLWIVEHLCHKKSKMYRPPLPPKKFKPVHTSKPLRI